MIVQNVLAPGALLYFPLESLNKRFTYLSLSASIYTYLLSWSFNLV